MSFKSKVVIVTGASSGIGAVTAEYFAKENADVVLVGRNEENLNNVAKKCAANGKTPLIIKADVSKDQDVERIINETIKKFNKLDVLINNAGILLGGTLEKGDMLSVYDEIMKTNLRSAVHLTMLATPYLIASKGNVVNVSSIASNSIFSQEFVAYCMSKAAMDHFGRGAALELGKHGVRVNTVNPGPVKTAIFATAGVKVSYDEMGFKTLLNRWSDSEEIAVIILFLASDRAKGITGSNFTCDNGYLVANN
ncbi:uncharacterized oxidoreductase SSP0419-like [Colias croceus]|uniref:uncharacterized oxidoreductase SSP0419-like n=1 Tax=Colias crocea TaxID=72248 RepID=UPI001E279E74|nr:uncharacterized oxidoreductase SSP0419-like [Colias croceus]